MSEKSSTKILNEALQKTKNHHEIGNHRIRAYYDESYEYSEEFPDLEKAPHNSIMNEGIELINLAYEKMSGGRNEIGNRELDAELILYGVGMERLLTGIYLKLEPEDFIQKIENTGESPSFEKARDLVVSDFADLVEDDVVGKLRLILDIVKEHRNNEVHLGYHQYIHGEITPLVLEVAFGLGYLYIDEKQDGWEQIGKKLSKHLDEQPTAKFEDFQRENTS